MSQEDYLIAAEPAYENTRKLRAAEDKVRKARDIVQLLKAADESVDDGQELSLRTLDQLDRIQSLLKSAAKKIDKYGDEQRWREVEKSKQGGSA